MSQKARVLSALRSRGARGITAADFASGRVIDGQKPIMRVAARVLELRQDGHRIVVEGERDGGCYVYRLLEDAQDAHTQALQAVREEMQHQNELAEDLLVGRPPRLAIFDDEDWAA